MQYAQCCIYLCPIQHSPRNQSREASRCDDAQQWPQQFDAGRFWYLLRTESRTPLPENVTSLPYRTPTFPREAYHNSLDSPNQLANAAVPIKKVCILLQTAENRGTPATMRNCQHVCGFFEARVQTSNRQNPTPAKMDLGTELSPSAKSGCSWHRTSVAVHPVEPDRIDLVAGDDSPMLDPFATASSTCAVVWPRSTEDGAVRVALRTFWGVGPDVLTMHQL